MFGKTMILTSSFLALEPMRKGRLAAFPLARHDSGTSPSDSSGWRHRRELFLLCESLLEAWQPQPSLRRNQSEMWDGTGMWTFLPVRAIGARSGHVGLSFGLLLNFSTGSLWRCVFIFLGRPSLPFQCCMAFFVYREVPYSYPRGFQIELRRFL